MASRIPDGPSKPMTVPLSLIVALLDGLSSWSLVGAIEIRRVVFVATSRRNTSSTPLVSRTVRFVAADKKTMDEPLADMSACWLAPLP